MKDESEPSDNCVDDGGVVCNELVDVEEESWVSWFDSGLAGMEEECWEFWFDSGLDADDDEL